MPCLCHTLKNSHWREKYIWNGVSVQGGLQKIDFVHLVLEMKLYSQSFLCDAFSLSRDTVNLDIYYIYVHVYR
jgi:hypothetical protein